MRNLKKVLGMVLCLAMMLSIMVVGAGAAFADQSEIDSKHKDAVDMCVSLNIINGIEQDGKTIFKPTGNVTREQMAKMICILDNGGKEPQLASGSSFSDVSADRWSNPYIEACASRGVVAGVGGGKFNPGGDVTASQAAKMLLVELGYKEDLAKYTGSGWDTRVNIDATKNGYYEDLEDIDVTAPLSREHAAQMIWNALQAKEIVYDYTLVTDPVTGQLISKEDPKSTNTELLADKYGASVKQAYLVGTTYNSTKDEYTYKFANSTFNGDTIGSADYFAKGSIKDSRDFSDLFGMKVKVVSKDDKLFGITAFESEILTSGIVADLPKTISGDSVKIDGTTYDLDKAATATPIYAFNVDTAVASSLVGYRSDSTGYYAFDLIDNNDDGDANVLVVHPVKVAQLTFVNNTEVRISGDKFTYEDDTIYDGAAKDDWVLITAKANTADGKNVVEKLDPITGTVNGKDGDSIRISGEWYDKANGVSSVPNNKDEVEVIAYNGYYFDASGVSSALDVAVVTGIGDWNSMDSVLPVKLMFKDGTENVVNVEKWNALEKNALKSDANASSPTVAKIDVMVAFDEDDGDYTLKDVANNAAVIVKSTDKSDYTGVVATSGTAKYDKDKAAVIVGSKTLDVADDAFIVIYDGDDYTYMTGADLLKKNSINFAFTDGKTTPTSYSLYAAVDGNELGALFAYTGDTVSSGDEMYAYIISADTQVNADNKDKVYLEVVIDGEKKADVETNKNASDLSTYNKEGTIIQYTMNGKVMNIEKVIDTTTLTDTITDTNKGKLMNGAIKEFNDSRVLVYQDGSTTDTYRFLLTKDTTIIAYDSDNDYAYVGKSLVEAPASAIGTDGKASAYYKNAYFTVNTDGEIEVIFVDVYAPEI